MYPYLLSLSIFLHLYYDNGGIPHHYSHIISHHFQRITSEILRILHLTYQGAFIIPITIHTIFIGYMLGLQWILHMICIPYVTCIPFITSPYDFTSPYDNGVYPISLPSGKLTYLWKIIMFNG